MVINKKPQLKKIVAILVLLLLAWFAASFLFAQPVNEYNTTLIKGHFRYLQKEVNRGEDSYDLYIDENKDYYKIAADNVNCFDSSNFSLIQQGQLIELYINHPTWRFGRPMVVRITSNKQTYFSFDCMNNTIEKERIWGPIACLGIGVLLCIVIYKEEVKEWFKNQR